MLSWSKCDQQLIFIIIFLKIHIKSPSKHNVMVHVNNKVKLIWQIQKITKIASRFIKGYQNYFKTRLELQTAQLKVNHHTKSALVDYRIV